MRWTSSRRGVGGVVGALLTGVFADTAWGASAEGMLAGRPAQIGVQAPALVAVAAYSGAVSFGLLKLLALMVELRPSVRAEGVGLDLAEHGEEANAQVEGAILVLDEAPSRASIPAIAQPA